MRLNKREDAVQVVDCAFVPAAGFRSVTAELDHS